MISSYHIITKVVLEIVGWIHAQYFFSFSSSCPLPLPALPPPRQGPILRLAHLNALPFPCLSPLSSLPCASPHVGAPLSLRATPHPPRPPPGARGQANAGSGLAKKAVSAAQTAGFLAKQNSHSFDQTAVTFDTAFSLNKFNRADGLHKQSLDSNTQSSIPNSSSVNELKAPGRMFDSQNGY